MYENITETTECVLLFITEILKQNIEKTHLYLGYPTSCRQL